MTNTYPDHILAMNYKDLEGYLKQFTLLRSKHFNTDEEAFEATEDLFFAYFKHNRFTSYESFKNARSRYYRRKSKSNNRK